MKKLSEYADRIVPIASNLEHIAKEGKINGSLKSSIEKAMKFAIDDVLLEAAIKAASQILTYEKIHPREHAKVASEIQRIVLQIKKEIE